MGDQSYLEMFRRYQPFGFVFPDVVAEHQAVLSGTEDDVRLFGEHGDFVAGTSMRAQLPVVPHALFPRDLSDSHLTQEKRLVKCYLE